MKSLIAWSTLVVTFVVLAGCVERTTLVPVSVDAATEDASVGDPDTVAPDLADADAPADGEAAPMEKLIPGQATVPLHTPEERTEAEAPAVEYLTIGSEAPDIMASAWVKGEPVEAFDPGQVYVVEFWATWCPPCRASMPHLSSLQEEYGDAVRFIGFSSEEEDVVVEFLGTEQSAGKSWDEVVTYTLAMDDGRATTNAYMQAAGQSGIPTAFIVGRDGTIEWIGHPMRMDQPLEQVVANTWDRVAARDKYEAAERAERARNEALRKIRDASRKGDWDAAIAAVEPLVEEFPDDAGVIQLKMSVLQNAGRTEQLQQLQAGLVELQWENPLGLNAIAWNIASGRQPGDMQLALRAAEQANKLTNEENGPILDTLARVHYELGDLDMAIKLQQKAVAVEPGHAGLQETLDQYLAEQAKAEEGPDRNEAP